MAAASDTKKKMGKTKSGRCAILSSVAECQGRKSISSVSSPCTLRHLQHQPAFVPCQISQCVFWASSRVCLCALTLRASACTYGAQSTLPKCAGKQSGRPAHGVPAVCARLGDRLAWRRVDANPPRTTWTVLGLSLCTERTAYLMSVLISGPNLSFRQDHADPESWNPPLPACNHTLQALPSPRDSGL